MKKLSIVIPSYKEEENLRVLLPRLISVLQTLDPEGEILIVDTLQAMDKTEDVCRSFDARVRYIHRQGGNNFGDAVRTGIRMAEGEWIVCMDADGSHDPEFISTLYQYRNDFDVVIASRYVAGGATKNSAGLIAMSRMVNIIYSVVLNLNCYDVSNSFKLYRAVEMKKLNLYCNNFDIVEEILFKLKKNNKNLKIKEVPFTFNQRMFGKTKRSLLTFMVTYVFTLFKLRFGK